MEENYVDKRLEQLRKARKEYESYYDTLSKRLEEANIRLAVIDGQIAERLMDKQESSPVSELPYYKTLEELDAAKAERGKSFRGKGLEETKIEREAVYQNEAEGWIDELDKAKSVQEPGRPPTA